MTTARDAFAAAATDNREVPEPSGEVAVLLDEFDGVALVEFVRLIEFRVGPRLLRNAGSSPAPNARR